MIIQFLIRKYNNYLTYKKLVNCRKYLTLDETCIVSKNFRYKTNSKKKIIVGKNSHLNGYFKTAGQGIIRIGDFCSFRKGTFIGALESVIIGNNVFGAEHIFISDNNNHPTSPKDRIEMSLTQPGSHLWSWDNKKIESSKIIVGNNVWIGRYAMILKGAQIGDHSIIAAGAIVTKSFPPYSVIAGNPARIVKLLPKN